MTWRGDVCPTCGHVRFRALMDDWRRQGLLAALGRAHAMPRGPERRERMRNIAQDYGVSLRTAQRYLKEAREAA